MKIIKLILLLLFVNFSNIVIGQNKKIDGFKKILPRIIKALQEPKIEKPLTEETSGFFKKPWGIKKLEDSEVQEIIKEIVDNKRFRIKKDYNGKWKLTFFSKFKNSKSIEEIYKSDENLSNTFIQVSEVKIFDKVNNSAYLVDKNKRFKYNESKILNFNNGQIYTTFPIIKEYSKLNGNIKITLKEYSKIEYKVFKKGDINVEFNIGKIKALKLLKIAKNKAYFLLPKTIDNLEIRSTNIKDEEFSSNLIRKIPEKVYNFGIKKNLDEKAIKSFIENLSEEDIYKKNQMLIYETNGAIENLYIYLKSNEKDLISKKIDIKL